MAVIDSDNCSMRLASSAARLDDALNLAPARLSGLLLCLAGGGGWRVLWRDAGNHASPNAGWPEAASAGALDLVLLGPRRYAGGDAKADWLGDGRARATLSDIRRMLALFAVACFLAAALVALIALLIQAR